MLPTADVPTSPQPSLRSTNPCTLCSHDVPNVTPTMPLPPTLVRQVYDTRSPGHRPAPRTCLRRYPVDAAVESRGSGSLDSRLRRWPGAATAGDAVGPTASAGAGAATPCVFAPPAALASCCSLRASSSALSVWCAASSAAIVWLAAAILFAATPSSAGQ